MTGALAIQGNDPVNEVDRVDSDPYVADNIHAAKLMRGGPAAALANVEFVIKIISLVSLFDAQG